MSAQRLEQKGRYSTATCLLQTGHLAAMRTAREGGVGRSGGIIVREIWPHRGGPSTRRPRKRGRHRCRRRPLFSSARLAQMHLVSQTESEQVHIFTSRSSRSSASSSNSSRKSSTTACSLCLVFTFSIASPLPHPGKKLPDRKSKR